MNYEQILAAAKDEVARKNQYVNWANVPVEIEDILLHQAALLAMQKVAGQNYDYCIHFKGEDLIIQSAPYIEDGFYIVVNEKITLFEIPNGGGEPIEIGEYQSIKKAIEATNSLT